MSNSEDYVVIVDDDELVRNKLGYLVGSVGMQTRLYENAKDLLSKEATADAVCVLLDVRMPEMSGVELIENFGQQIPCPIIMLTGYAEVSTAVRCMKAGAFDYFEKPFSDQALLDRICQARDVFRRYEGRQKEQMAIQEKLAELTTRENEVLEYVVQGLSNKQIADHLELSSKTVDVHRARIMKKMEADNAASLVRMVVYAKAIQSPRQFHSNSVSNSPI